MVVSRPWPGMTIVSGARVLKIRRSIEFNLSLDNLTNRDYYETQNYFDSRVTPGAPVVGRIHGTPGYPLLDRVDDGREVPELCGGVPRTSREQGVARQQDRRPLDLKAHGSGCMARGMDRPQPQATYLEHVVVFQKKVVGGEHGGILSPHSDLVAGITQLGDSLDVVPMAVGLDDLAYSEAPAELKELLVLVGRVDEESLAAQTAAHHEHVVVHGSDDDLVDLDLLVLVVHVTAS